MSLTKPALRACLIFEHIVLCEGQFSFCKKKEDVNNEVHSRKPINTDILLSCFVPDALDCSRRSLCRQNKPMDKGIRSKDEKIGWMEVEWGNKSLCTYLQITNTLFIADCTMEVHYCSCQKLGSAKKPDVDTSDDDIRDPPTSFRSKLDHLDRILPDSQTLLLFFSSNDESKSYKALIFSSQYL